MDNYALYEQNLKKEMIVTLLICGIIVISMIIAYPKIKRIIDGNSKEEKLDRICMKAIAVFCISSSIIISAFTISSTYYDIHNRTYVTYRGSFEMDDGFVSFVCDGEEYRLSARNVHEIDGIYEGFVVYATKSQVVVDYAITKRK